MPNFQYASEWHCIGRKLDNIYIGLLPVSKASE
jgi:hypothetical protein